jgi:hypothetical protein
MQATTQNLDDTLIPVVPFHPDTEAEEITANIIRTMLKFEVLRVQLETPDLIIAPETERFVLHQQASTLRVEGYRAQKRAISSGINAVYDDYLLRREGIRIAYFLARGAKNQASLIEEEVISISVNKALYNIDDDRISIDYDFDLIAA